MEPSEASDEHRWLERFVGTWAMRSECDGENQPFVISGTETGRSLGGLWVQLEGRGTVPGSDDMFSLMAVGYVPTTKKYVGSWISSAMTHQFVYEGRVENDDTLVLETTGPDMHDPTKSRRYRDINVFESNDRRAFRSEMLGDDGTWSVIMTAEYTRIS